MKRKIAYVAVPVLGLMLLSAGTVSAFGGGFGMFSNATPEEIATRQQEMFTREATILGVGVDVIKNGWAAGKTITDIAKEQGITTEQLQTKMQATREVQMKEHLATLVSKGVITQAQADSRLAFVKSNPGKGGMGMGNGRGGKGQRGGMGMGRGLSQ